MMVDDSFETVAITYSQPETAVMLSMFAFYGIPAYAAGFDHARAVWPVALALGGIHIRVLPDSVGEARALLAEVAERPQATRPRLILNPVLRIVAYALVLLLSVGVPTRTGSTFFLGRRA
jgi:hypothetical protein